MRQEYIEAFLEIVKTRNVTKAAANLHLSQSAVSNYLKRIEEELDVQLILRHKGHRNVELTCHGEEFIYLAENWMSLLQQTERMKKNPSMELTIGTVDSLNDNIMFPACQNMITNHTLLYLKTYTDQSSQLYHLADNREIDIGFVSYDARLPNVTAKPAFIEKMCVVRNCKNSGHEPITHPHQLQVKDEIMIHWGAAYREWHDQWWDKKEIPHVDTDSMFLLRRFINTPGCWALIPQIDLPDILTPDIEVCNLEGIQMPERTLYQIQPRYAKPSRAEAVQLFKESLCDWIRNNDTLVLL